MQLVAFLYLSLLPLITFYVPTSYHVPVAFIVPISFILPGAFNVPIISTSLHREVPLLLLLKSLLTGSYPACLMLS
ncbi:hypothetical protein [Bartonella apis]|uniref:hypothetical protein n=1 Tax=Bartonella apis TaxID=1686310 RepID=UPI003BB629FD